MALSLAIILILSLIIDSLFKKINIPSLIGMLFIGIVMTLVNRIDPSLLAIGVDLRMIALIVILLRAGFELSFNTLKKVGREALLLSFLPALFEVITVTFLAPKLLGLSYIESALLGTVLGAVSPAVVVPLMLQCIEQKRGTEKGIPTLILAGASLDDVTVIIAFSALLSLYVGEQVNLFFTLISIPLSIVLAIGVGMLIGLVLLTLFKRYNPRATKRVLIILGLSILLVYLQDLLDLIHIPFAGLLSVMAIGFIILQKNEEFAHELSSKLGKIWIFSEILLFTLVGAQVDVEVALQAGLKSVALIGIALIVRSVGTWFSILGSPFTVKERLFIVISYLPKATVQAAIGGTPLLMMHMYGMPSEAGEIILAVAVMSILLTAPLGSWAIHWASKKLLSQEKITP